MTQLTEARIRAAKPQQKPYKLRDSRGLYLLVTPPGGRLWRLRYRLAGRESMVGLGAYPDIPLATARERRDAARKLVASGVNPAAVKRAERSQRANTFEAIALEWLGKRQYAQVTVEKAEWTFRDLLFPYIGLRPVAQITAPEILEVLRRIESRGKHETAHRTKQRISQVLRYAIATGRCERDPSGDLRGALPAVKGEHFAATTEPSKLAGILRAMDGYEGMVIVRCALRLAPLVFVRPGELRKAEWSDIDLEGAEWRYFVSKTKTQHIVPLARQAVEILRELHPLTGSGRLVFPGARSNQRPMSDNAILAAMRRMGISKDEMSGHGFRAVARTILDEVLGVRPDYIEHQLAHAVRDPNGRAYNRTAHLPERRKMMQQWADYLDNLKAGLDLKTSRPAKERKKTVSKTRLIAGHGESVSRPRLVSA